MRGFVGAVVGGEGGVGFLLEDGDAFFPAAAAFPVFFLSIPIPRARAVRHHPKVTWARLEAVPSRKNQSFQRHEREAKPGLPAGLLTIDR